MSGLNKCMFIGNLGKDPAVKTLPDGRMVVSMSIGVNSSWKDRQGVKQEHTEWIRCEAFGKLAEIIAKYLTKGSKVYVEGRQETDKYKDKEGRDCYATKTVLATMLMLGNKPQQAPSQNSDYITTGDDFPNQDVPFDDDIPF